MQYNSRTQLRPRKQQSKNPSLLDLLHKLSTKPLIYPLIKYLKLGYNGLLISRHFRIYNQGPWLEISQQIDIIVEEIAITRVELLSFWRNGDCEHCVTHVDGWFGDELDLV